MLIALHKGTHEQSESKIVPDFLFGATNQRPNHDNGV